MSVSGTYEPTLPRLVDVERWLDDHRVAWRIDEVLVADVDQVAGLANQTRLEALNGEAVARYTADMEGGATFPPVVLRADGGRWVPVDGNHRITAARDAGRVLLAAYLLDDVTVEQAHELSIAANRTHGLPLTDEERLWHAVAMVADGSSIAGAAGTCGIPTGRLQNHLAATRFARRCTDAGIGGWSKLPTTTRARLDTIGDARVFRRTVDLACSGALITSEVADTISRVNQLPTGDALDLLNGIRRDARGRTRNGRGHPPSATTSPRRRLVTDLDLLMSRFTADAVAADCGTAMARQQVSDQIKAAARHLMRIERELWR